MNIEKYKNNGWGLSRQCFVDIEKILQYYDHPNIVEFGSGISTSFLVDNLTENKKQGKIYSFDNSEEYASKIIDDKLKLSIRKIVECDDVSFEEMFKNKKINYEKLVGRTLLPHTRQKNCFYNINSTDIPENIDVVIVDGPHGNGRSFSFLHLKDKMSIGSHIIIDDFNHYDFVERLLMIFPNATLHTKVETGKINQWELGGNYVIYKL